MMQAPRYERRKNFMQDNGDQTDHIALNTEFDAASLSINVLRQNLSQIQRDDGALQDGIVDADTLSGSFKEDLIHQMQQHSALVLQLGIYLAILPGPIWPCNRMECMEPKGNMVLSLVCARITALTLCRALSLLLTKEVRYVRISA